VNDLDALNPWQHAVLWCGFNTGGKFELLVLETFSVIHEDTGPIGWFVIVDGTVFSHKISPPINSFLFMCFLSYDTPPEIGTNTNCSASTPLLIDIPINKKIVRKNKA
jgi:hypothetical protein